MRVSLVSLEDGIMACGFRKMAAYVERLHPDTHTYFVSTNNYRSLIAAIKGAQGGSGVLNPEYVDEIAQELAGSDLIGFSSMTGYRDLTKAVMSRVREVSPDTTIVWGGIHPIIHPEDAIQAPVDAICTGEGEFAFEQFFDKWKDGRDYTDVCNFWFPNGDDVIRNDFLPLQTAEEMETLPFPKHSKDELLYSPGSGFRRMSLHDRLTANGLSYNTVWSIGCPFKCTYCGNTKFIANDNAYRRLRHPSPAYAIEEVKSVRKTFPYISTVCFHDDSFMAISYDEIVDFAERWRSEVGIPFAVYGVIPNYVRRDKIEVLTWAGMNRIRMGVQSGSQRILDFYKRPSPPQKVLAAADVTGSFAPKYHIPPAYDIITDNPIETRQDVVDTLEVIYNFRRPFTLNIFSLKVIPNTQLEEMMKEEGVDVEEISSNYVNIPPRWANLLLYLLTLWRPPRWLFNRLLKPVKASGEPQRMYPVLGRILRALFMLKRGVDHLRHLDFSTIPGYSGYVVWRVGLLRWWWRKRTPRPEKPEIKKAPVRIPLEFVRDANDESAHSSEPDEFEVGEISA